MLVPRAVLEEIKNRIGNIKDKNEPIEDSQSRLKISLIDAILALQEYQFGHMGERSEEENKKFIQQVIDPLYSYLFFKTEEKEELNKIIDNCVENLEFFLTRYKYRMWHSTRFNKYFNNDNYYVDEITMQLCTPAISPVDRTINVIDPWCKTPENLLSIKNTHPTSVLYAAGVNERNSHMIRDRVDKIALSSTDNSLAGSHITNSAFDIMVIQPTIEMELYHKTAQRKEKQYLGNIPKYLRYGGYAFIIMPYFRIYNDLRSELAKSFDNIQIRRGLDFEETGNVIILARRKKGKVRCSDSYKTLGKIYNPKNIPNIIQNSFREVFLSSGTCEIEVFRGSLLDEEELKRICQNSSAMKEFWESQKSKLYHEQVGKPPLPFNEGRVGLVLASGFLDGVIEEGNGHSHIVKGRVRRRIDEDSEVEDETLHVTETQTHRVEINMLLPDGTRKVLV